MDGRETEETSPVQDKINLMNVKVILVFVGENHLMTRAETWCPRGIFESPRRSAPMRYVFRPDCKQQAPDVMMPWQQEKIVTSGRGRWKRLAALIQSFHYIQPIIIREECHAVRRNEIRITSGVLQNQIALDCSLSPLRG